MSIPTIFTIIVIAKEQATAEEALRALKLIKFSQGDYEILLAIGNNPSSQRNEAVSRAKGEWILFLDNDSVVATNVLQLYYQWIKLHPQGVVCGGPSLLRAGNSIVQKIIDRVLTNPLLVSSISSRYQKSGKARKVDDLELIMCNMLVKKSCFQQIGGLNPLLYPNEENCFLQRVAPLGEVWYLPDIQVFREHKHSWPEFALQIFRYGVGRSKQVLSSNGVLNMGFLGVIIFILYCFTLPILLLQNYWWGVPLLGYIAYILWANRQVADNYLLTVWYAITCHFAYGIGLLVGFFHPLKNNDNIKINIINIYSKDLHQF